ncbi:MAG: Ig-like domain-containing protein, partial [Actinomycetia bacterium]|nr:Ig-like domain-containing protein [Actinomycetes bacterium]
GRGLLSDEVDPTDFVVVDSAGEEVSVDTNLFYRNDSHVVHLIPLEDWTEWEDYTVTVLGGLASRDGSVLGQDYRFDFSTRPEPPVVDDLPETDGCSCGSAQPSGLPGWILLAGLAIARPRRQGTQRGR